MRRALITLAVAAVVGLIGWLVWRRWHEPPPEAGGGGAGGGRGRGAAAVPVETAPIRHGPIRDLRLFTGTIEPRASYVVAPKVGGRLLALEVNLGDPVTTGALIAQLDDEEYRQQVAQAEAAREVAAATVEQQRTSVALAERERERLRRLWERQAAAESAWDAADAEQKIQAAKLKVALAQLAEREAALKADQVRLAYTRISLPQDAAGGRWFVAERHVDEGAMLAANTPLVTVVDLARVIVVIHAIERDYPELRLDAPVELETDAHPGRSFAGRIVRIAPTLQAATRQARIEVEADNGELALRPGMFVRVRIEFAKREAATLVPRAALIRHNGRMGVFLADRTAGVARFAPVTPEIEQDELVAIAEKELSGEVVTLGQHLLSDGSPVLLPSATPDPASAPPRL